MENQTSPTGGTQWTPVIIDPGTPGVRNAIKTLWKGRFWILIITGLGLAMGIFVAKFSTPEYTATTLMIPQMQSEKTSLGNLGGLAAMAGIDLNTMDKQSGLSPMVYPEIVRSLPFQKGVMYQMVEYDQSGKRVTYKDFITKIEKPSLVDKVKKYTIKLPSQIFKKRKEDIASASQGGARGNDTLMIHLTQDEIRMRNVLNEKMKLDVNPEKGYIQLYAKASNPKVAAEMALKGQQLLQDLVTEYKVEQAKQNRDFIEERYAEKKVEFEVAQARLARFNDRNQNINSAMARTEEEQLLSEKNLAFSVFTEIAKQLENAQIKVKENTPVFSIIEPVTVPHAKSAPRAFRVILLWIFGSIVISVTTLMLFQGIKSARKIMDEEAAA